MLLSSIHIKHLQSIPGLKIFFDSNIDVTVILGANGIGKTTALQAMSLLGHLPTMSVLHRKAGCWELLKPIESDGKLTHERISDLQLEQAETRRIVQGSSSAKAWFESADGTSPGGICEFVLNHPSEGKPTVFYIFVRDNTPAISEDIIKDSDQMSLSRMLSAEAISDSDFWRFCTIVVDEKHFDFTAEIVRTQFFCRPASDFSLRCELLGESGLSTAIHYLNTDLNDSGRGFDLRESPKDLYKDFEEFCRRFGITRSDANSSKIIKQLNDALAAVVTYPKSLQGDGALGKTPLAVQSLLPRKASSALNSSAIVVKRYETSNVATDFLSSGENEVFFLFLILFSIPEASMVVMDEPDMHISNFQKKRFFSELFSIAKARNIRLIVSTHSDVALTLRPRVRDAKTRIDARMIRYGETLSSPMESDFREDFLIESALEHWSVALGAVRNVFSFRGVRAIPQLVQSQLERNTAQVALYLSVLGSLIVTIASFVVDMILLNNPDHVKILTKSLLIFFIAGTALIAVSYLIGLFQKNRKKDFHDNNNKAK